LTSTFRVWLKFNGVGVMGIGVQLATLTLLKTAFRVHYLAATIVAVETALLHNFAWHERWTWVDRTHLLEHGALKRLGRFHLANGLISIAGNLLLTWLLVSRLHIHYFAANLMAIGTCSIANFFASDRFVFQRREQIL
jgi:putative flippase GtrA